MPCFKGLAVSVHTPDGPLSEYSIQRQTRLSRITSYVPVPPAKVRPESKTGRPEQSTFAISITLLTPGQEVPYSTPKPTLQNPTPRARTVGGVPGFPGGSSKETLVPPYVPRTLSPNETIAAYIYFDGRAKEEVATLLRRGEETWVNSRWVSVPEAEGGGLAEREFLFREVGLERWLNGLDLEGKDKAERIQRRQRRLERKRLKKKDLQQQREFDMDSDDAASDVGGALHMRRASRNAVLRYGGADGSPVEDLTNDGTLFSSDSDSDDEGPQPEAAGQIKVALYRVLASGEVKRGEYSPQFGAHDDDDDHGNGSGHGNTGDEEVDHTTTFAKPKTLDPKTISTQTVTGLDGPESPYAIFTFFYRGEKQLQKMKILPTPETETASAPTRRKASGPDFTKFAPLLSHGTIGFTGYRDVARGKKNQKDRDADAMDSDVDDDDESNVAAAAARKAPEIEDEVEVTRANEDFLSPEDMRRQGEVVDGVQKMKLKRQHSAEPVANASVFTSSRRSPHFRAEDSPSGGGTPQSINSIHANAGTPPESGLGVFASAAGLDTTGSGDPGESIGSPYKRHRSSVPGLNGFTSSASPAAVVDATACMTAASGGSGSVDDRVGGGAGRNLDDTSATAIPETFGGPLPNGDAAPSLLPAAVFTASSMTSTESPAPRTKSTAEDEEL